ncbi:MAG: ATP-dependent Clp protease ATP-binding subunit ClpB, partial [Thermoanaerobacteraceae bacterium]|nr:ATP-dependent Clp protease ATP-binding subunit ClpB [Thermoanaerobacteraceae bacterium]
MDINKYTQKSTEALAEAQKLAVERHHQEVTPRHLLLSLLIQEDGFIPRLLTLAGVNHEMFKTSAEDIVRRIPSVHGYDGPLAMSSGLLRVMVRAEKEASRMKDEYVSVEHLLLALMEEGDGDIKDVFKNFGLDRNRILDALKKIRGSQQVTSENPEATYDALNRYGRDFTRLAREGKLDPVIGRDEEIRRVIEILS